MKLCNDLGISLEALAEGEIRKRENGESTQVVLSAKAMEWAQLYSRLDMHGQKAVRQLMEMETERCSV